MKFFGWYLAPFLLLAACGGGPAEITNEQTARKYCGSCHIFPSPELLDKETWKQAVLPPMATLLGIDYLYQVPLNKADKNAISAKDWDKIVTYYMEHAPAKMPLQQRTPVQHYTDLFEVEKVIVAPGSFPASSFVKIDPGNHWIYAAGAFDSTLNIYDASLNCLLSYNVHGVIVDIDFGNSLQAQGERSGIITNIGMMNPNDLETGTIDTITISATGSIRHHQRLVDSLPRPVQVTRFPSKGSSKQDYLVCGFGNIRAGALLRLKGTGSNGFKKEVISPMPGAIKAYIDDYNKDSLNDIMVLMAQSREGIYLLLNDGSNHFIKKELLSFPPVYGSSYFELADFNQDGFSDILYTCGDNADYTSKVLKNYHGIYIFLNDGHYNFRKEYFYPVHGCFKAMARDFDKDGDLDIAAISYFPDIKNQPQESFVYLEQTQRFEFKASGVRAYNEGNWLTMDAGDVDGDGDEDIVLGSLIPPVESQQKKWKISGLQKTGLMLLRNRKVNN